MFLRGTSIPRAWGGLPPSDRELLARQESPNGICQPPDSPDGARSAYLFVTGGILLAVFQPCTVAAYAILPRLVPRQPPSRSTGVVARQFKVLLPAAGEARALLLQPAPAILYTLSLLQAVPLF